MVYINLDVMATAYGTKLASDGFLVYQQKGDVTLVKRAVERHGLSFVPFWCDAGRLADKYGVSFVVSKKVPVRDVLRSRGNDYPYADVLYKRYPHMLDATPAELLAYLASLDERERYSKEIQAVNGFLFGYPSCCVREFLKNFSPWRRLLRKLLGRGARKGKAVPVSCRAHVNADYSDIYGLPDAVPEVGSHTVFSANLPRFYRFALKVLLPPTVIGTLTPAVPEGSKNIGCLLSLEKDCRNRLVSATTGVARVAPRRVHPITVFLEARGGRYIGYSCRVRAHVISTTALEFPLARHNK